MPQVSPQPTIFITSSSTRRMVWQEKVLSVVMITNLVEGKKTKCEQYWPSSGSQDFGPFHVSITHQLILADYTIRALSVEVEGTFF